MPVVCDSIIRFAICVANKRRKLLLESSGNNLRTTGENLQSTHFHHCFKIRSVGLLSSWFHCVNK